MGSDLGGVIVADRRRDTALHIQDAVSAGRHTLVLSGELDIASAEQLVATIRDVCSTGTTGLVLNLAKLTFMDSSGLQAILAAGAMCEKHDREFLLVPGPHNIQRVFEITGLAGKLPFEHAQPPYSMNISSRKRRWRPVSEPSLTVEASRSSA
jgi:anti-sigma B factor antagonist